MSEIERQHQQTFDHLGYDHILHLLADEAHGAPVHARLLKLYPGSDRQELEQRFTRIQELWQFDSDGGSLALSQYDELDDVLQLLAIKDSTLQPQALLDIQNILEQTRVLEAFFQHRIDAESSSWTELVNGITVHKALESDIQRVVGPDAKVLDSASPELSKLRRQIDKAAGSVRSRMQGLVKHYHSEGWLMEEQATMKAGRLVLPVQSSYKNQVSGVIQDQSNTGATTFIEPIELIELNNHIKSLKIEEQREIERILKATTALLHPHASEIERNYEVLQEIDFHVSLARFGKRFDASIPELVDRPQLRLIAARNPRLQLQREVVPLDLDMPPDVHTILVTGPNAGGKTVVLKTVGLLSVMANSGLPIPAEEGSRIPLFDNVYSDIGDQQSLVNDLSTFSAHIQSIIGITRKASAGSLVLLDELGTGTDPSEGGALARAILEKLGEIGCKTIATTHLGDLKVYAHEAEQVINGAMEFDQAALQPTYRFQAGVPGSSYGFEISKRLGLAGDILTQAKDYLGARRESLENLLRNLEAERQETQALRTTAEQLERELSRKQKQIDSGLAKVKKAEKHAERDAAVQAQDIIRTARKTVEQVIREIREGQASRQTIKSARDTMAQLESKVDDMAVEPLPDIPEAGPLEEEDLQSGHDVLVRTLNQVGKIVGEPSGGKVYVDVDGLRMKVPLDWLAQAPESEQKAPAEKIVVNVQTESKPNYTLDLRGYRAEAAISELRAFIDQALLANMNQLQIIHGKGTGVIKKVVHEVLKEHRAVKTWRLGGLDEGGAGVTFAELK